LGLIPTRRAEEMDDLTGILSFLTDPEMSTTFATLNLSFSFFVKWEAN